MTLGELIQVSPIRVFEKAINGGLKAGEIGIITSPKGVGKTSVLVQLALDKLLQEKKVIHVSFSQHTNYMQLWYEDLFNEFINKKDIENPNEIKSELIKNRVQMNFSQDGITITQILKSLRSLIIEGGFNANLIIIDGFKFSGVEKACIENVKKFAVESGVSIWYSCSVKDESTQYNEENIPVDISPISALIDVVIKLQPKSDFVELSVSKDRDLVTSKSIAMKLDPKTLLMLEA